jgi:hypothetical protein
LIEEIKKNQNAAVSLFNPPTIIHPFAALTKDPKLEFNVSFQVTSNTAKNLRPYAEMWLEDSPPNGHADRDVVTRFKIETAKNMPDRGTDLGPSTMNWNTLPLDLFGQSGQDIVAGKRTIYFLARVEQPIRLRFTH